MRNGAIRFYKSKQWQRVSRLYMTQQNYICERCGGAAVICHHRKYITPANLNDPAITLNLDNLEALCQECHNKEHFQKYTKAIFDGRGEMVGAKESAELEEYKKAIEALQRKLLTSQEGDEKNNC